MWNALTEVYKDAGVVLQSSGSLKASSSPSNANGSESNLTGEVGEDAAPRSLGRRQMKQKEFPW